MNELAIKIDNVSKEYRLGAIGGTSLRDEIHRIANKLFRRSSVNPNLGKKFMALQDINLEIRKGERLGIIGHNGAGKSTLLKLIARVTGPTKGTISFNGRIASMLEVGTGFHGELTGRENIYMNGAILGMTKKEIDSKIDAIIHFAEMEKFIDTPVKRYSSGMYVKLAFSVAAHLNSEIMIMDEVLAVGDTRFQQKCLDMMGICSKEDGRTVLYVSHNMSTIQYLCDRVVVMEHGKLIFDGKPDDAIAHYMKNDLLCDTIVDVRDRIRETWNFGNVRFDFFEIIDAQDCQFKNDSILKVRIRWHVVNDIGPLILRLYIKHYSGCPLGCATLGLGHYKAGQIIDEIYAVPIKGIFPGKYCLSAEIHTINFPGDVPLCQDSSCGKVFVFDIVSGETSRVDVTKPDYSETIDWRHSNWGSIHFPCEKIVSSQIVVRP